MGLKEIFKAIREYPAVCSELRQTQQALEQSKQRCGALKAELREQKHHLNFLSQQSAALQAALEEFCPQLSTFQDLLSPQQREMVELISDRKTELKLYCPLSGELGGQMLDGSDLPKFQDAILQKIEGEQLPKKTERGLMADFDGLDYVDDKVFSVFPSVEEVDGQLYGVAVCQIRGHLSPGELEQLKEFCVEQFSYGWGEDFAQRPHRTEYGELYVSFWQDSDATILTKEELEAARAPSRPFHQLRENRGEHNER